MTGIAEINPADGRAPKNSSSSVSARRSRLGRIFPAGPFLIDCCLGSFSAQPIAAEAPVLARLRPLLRDFMELNVHTAQFKPDLYAPVCLLVRDFHSMQWDVGKDTAQAPQFPFAANRVDWGTMYGSWVETGFEINGGINP